MMLFMKPAHGLGFFSLRRSEAWAFNDVYELRVVGDVTGSDVNTRGPRLPIGSMLRGGLSVSQPEICRLKT